MPASGWLTCWWSCTSGCAGWGLVNDNSYEFPVTQEILADTLGLSVVHVNRTLRSLREDGYATVGFGRVCIRDLRGADGRRRRRGSGGGLLGRDRFVAAAGDGVLSLC